MTLKRIDVEKRMENATKTLSNLEKKKDDRISISRKSLIGYCNETIILCAMLLVLMEKK